MWPPLKIGTPVKTTVNMKGWIPLVKFRLDGLYVNFLLEPHGPGLPLQHMSLQLQDGRTIDVSLSPLDNVMTEVTVELRDSENDSRPDTIAPVPTAA